ncbi:MAG TPA: hypothetical protein VNO81_09930 [Candidatus Nitrosotenuis sp.]|jgi:glutathione synthase/RimK-type ligase-like ATP-grasp enzyme|nr:hypothetical protein [Candidatus Nitrosotenuis sp.]
MKIGVLRGRENNFPDTVIHAINSMNRGVTAEFIQLGGTSLGEKCPYRVILDRISHEVPYYQVYLKQASLQGTYVVNNPFWMNVDDKFFGYSLAQELGIPVPRTSVLPNRAYEADINEGSLRNLWPIDWKMRLEEVGLPCIMKPAFGGGWKNVHKISSMDEAIHHYENSGTLTMMLQELIEWDDYIRCLCIGRRHARAIRYIPRPYGQGEYVQDLHALKPHHAHLAEEYSRVFNEAIGYDMNAMEFAVRGDTLYAIDITNYVCDMDYNSLKDAHFSWAVETMAEFLVDLALSGARNAPTANWATALSRS